MNARNLGFAAALALLPPVASGAWAADSAAPDGRTPAAAAVLRGFSYQLAPAPRIPLPVLTATAQPAASQDSTGLTRLAAFSVSAGPDETYRRVNAALEDEKLSIPCDLIIDKTSAPIEFRALGAPLPPMDVSRPSGNLIASFPLVTLAW